MFDIGFSELLVIAVVALIVIGPERLPKVARTVGHLVGRLQRYVADVKEDINREIELDELRKMRDSFKEAAADAESAVRKELSQTEKDLNATLAAASEPPAAGSQAATPGAVEGGAAHPTPEVPAPAAHVPPVADKATLPESR